MRAPREVRNSSWDSYRPGSTSLSRRTSEAIAPPPHSAPSKTPQSESSTPRTSTSVTAKEVSLPRNSSAANASVLEGLTTFAQSITSAATLSFKRDFTKQQATAQERERDRQRRHKQHFITLIEDSELKAEGLNKSVTRLEKQVQVNMGSQAIIASKLASSIQKRASPGGSDIVDNTDSKHEISKLRMELRDARDDIRNLKRKALTQADLDEQRLVTKDDLRSHINNASASTEKEISKQSTEVSRLNQKILDLAIVTGQRDQNGQQHEITIAKRFDAADGSMSEVQTKVLDLEDSLRRLDTGINETRTKVLGSAEALESLNNFVRGNDSSDLPGLQELIKNESDRVSTILDLLRQLTEKVQALEQRLISQDSRLAQDADAARSRFATSLDIETLRQDLDTLKKAQQGSRDSTLSEEIAMIRGDLDVLKEEQDGKDACVTSDFERLEALVKHQAEEVKGLRQAQSNSRINSLNSPPTPPLATTPFGVDKPSHVKVQEIETGLKHLVNRINALDTVFSAQQQKFDGLTSDHVLSRMILHLRNMYPNLPANVAMQVSDVIRAQVNLDARQKVIEQKQNNTNYLTTNLQLTLHNMEQRVSAAANASVEIRSTLSKLADDLKNLRQDVSTQKTMTVDDETRQRLVNFDAKIADTSKKVEDMQNKYAVMVDKFSTEVSAVSTEISAMKTQSIVAGLTKDKVEELEKAFVAESKSKSIGSAIEPQVEGYPPDESDSDTPLGARIARNNTRASGTPASERKRKRNSRFRLEVEGMDAHQDRRAVGKGQRREEH